MKISIITVTYNCVDTIKRTIESVAMQDYDDIEYIIIDGQSTDGTKEVIQEFLSDVNVFISEKDSGIYNAMNKGVTRATGDIVYFLNGDDYLLREDIISDVSNEFRKKKKDILSCRVNIGYGNTSIKSFNDIDNELRFHAMLPHQGLFVKRSVFEKIGMFDESYKIAADYEWMLRAYDGKSSFGFSDLVIAFYAQDGRSKDDIGIIEQHEISRKYLERKGLYNDIDTEHKEYAESVRDWLMKKMIMNHPEVIASIITEKNRKNKKLAIWGGGIWGNRFFEVLESEGKKVNVIFDKNIDDEFIASWETKGTSVTQYNNDRDYYIIVAVSKAEMDIATQLCKCEQVSDIDFILFKDLKKEIIQRAVKIFSFDKLFTQQGDLKREEIIFGV